MKAFLLWAISPLYWTGAAAAAISVGGSIYTGKKQKDAIDEAEAAQLKAEQDAEDERRRIFEASAPQEASATVEFGTQDQGGGMTFNDFLTPTPVKEQSTLGGLGFGTV